MVGTREGGLKAAATNKAKYGEDFYKIQGAKAGRLGAADGVIKGFALSPERARWAGAKGGAISSRAGIKNGEGKSRRG